jgi:hypothetical protein
MAVRVDLITPLSAPRQRRARRDDASPGANSTGAQSAVSTPTFGPALP